MIQLGAGCQALGVKYNDKDAKVCYTLEQDDIYSELETIHEWYQDGIINPMHQHLLKAVYIMYGE